MIRAFTKGFETADLGDEAAARRAWLTMSEFGYGPPSRPGTRQDRSQAESGRESPLRPLSRDFGSFTLSSRHGG